MSDTYADDWSHGLAAGIGPFVYVIPTFTLAADLSQPYTLPSGFEWVGQTPDPSTYVTPRPPDASAEAPPAPPSPVPPGLPLPTFPEPPTPPATESPPQTEPASPVAGTVSVPTPTDLPPSLAPPETSPPAVVPRPPSDVPPSYTPRPPPASGGWSWEVYRELAKRAARDTAKRKAAPRTPRGRAPVTIEIPPALGGIAAGQAIGGIAGVLFPSEIGPEVTPRVTPNLPPIRMPTPSLPAPREPTLPRSSEPPVPELSRPPTPEVIEVTAPAPQKSKLPKPRAPKKNAKFPPLWPWAGLLAPMLRRARLPRSAPRENLRLQPQPTFPLPFAPPLDPLTPPRTPGSDPLTIQNIIQQSSSSPLPGSLTPPNVPSVTSTKQDDCKCEKPRKRKRKPSNTVARVHEYSKRMSVYSLRNLRKG